MQITYIPYDTVTTDEYITVVKSSGLGLYRPLDQPEQIQMMLDQAQLIISARDEQGQLVGIARSITDFCFCCYLSCLAVDSAYQRRGIGKELVRQTLLQLGEKVLLVLLSIPGSEAYYPKLGFQHHPAFIVAREDAHHKIVQQLTPK